MLERGPDRRSVGVPRQLHLAPEGEGRERFVGEPVGDQAACKCLDVELRVHAEIDDVGERPLEPRPVLGAGPIGTFRTVTLPLILPAVVSAFLIAFTTSFDEYAVASFVVGTRETFPIYLYAALRFPSQLPQVIAVAVVVITVSLLVVLGAELGRRRVERHLGAVDVTE